jgi:hypothetical protein
VRISVRLHLSAPAPCAHEWNRDGSTNTRLEALAILLLPPDAFLASRRIFGLLLQRVLKVLRLRANEAQALGSAAAAPVAQSRATHMPPQPLRALKRFKDCVKAVPAPHSVVEKEKGKGKGKTQGNILCRKFPPNSSQSGVLAWESRHPNTEIAAPWDAFSMECAMPGCVVQGDGHIRSHLIRFPPFHSRL